MKFYTYLWLRDNGIPYYVGKGKKYRARTVHRRIGSAPPADRVIIQEFESEEDAFAAEQFLIGFFGRKDLGTGVLVNRNDGGLGGIAGVYPHPRLGRKHSDETKHKIRMSKIGKPLSLEWRLKLKASHPKDLVPPSWKGKKHSEETRKRMVAANRRMMLGRKASQETREKMSKSHKGIKQTEEWIRRRVTARLLTLSQRQNPTQQ